MSKWKELCEGGNFLFLRDSLLVRKDGKPSDNGIPFWVLNGAWEGNLKPTGEIEVLSGGKVRHKTPSSLEDWSVINPAQQSEDWQRAWYFSY